MTASEAAVSRALDTAAHTPFWLTDSERPSPQQRLIGDATADLAVVGGGYTGLWTALLAKEAQPDLDVMVADANDCGHAASGRNGGFCSPSLTHGLANAAAHWPDEQDTLARLGQQNLDELERDLQRHQIDCGYTRSGKLAIAREPWQGDGLRAEADAAATLGQRATFLDQDAVRSYLDVPGIEAGLFQPDYALVNPAKLVWGLRAACLRLGVRIVENTPVNDISTTPAADQRIRLTTEMGSIRTHRVALATNAFPPLLRRLRLRFVPVWDYALVTEPLSEYQLRSINWTGPYGITDSANQFHYFRKTADNRILWGGYDAIYHYGGRTSEHLSQRPATFERLAATFTTTFPTLANIRFTHAWGGVIDTSSHFSMFAGTAAQGRIAYALGFTGLGVAATRFGAQVILDLLEGRDTERTRLGMIRRPPIPFPPEPLRYLAIQATQHALARQDRTGRRGPWLHILDRLGLGFST